MILLSWMISIFSIVNCESNNVESYGDSLIQVSSQQINGDVTKVILRYFVFKSEAYL